MSILVVQSKAISGALSGSFSVATTAGNCVAVAVNGFGNSSPPVTTGVTLGGSADNFVNAAESVSGFDGTAYILASAWADPNCAGGQTAVAVSGSNLIGLGIVIFEVSGLASSAVVDQTSTGSGTSGTSWSSGTTAATTVASEFWLGVNTTDQSATQPGSPWTNFQTGFNNYGAGYQIVSSTGTAVYSGTQVSGGSEGWAAVVVTLKASANVNLALPVAQVNVAAYPGVPSQVLQLPVAQVTVTAYTVGRGTLVSLPAAGVSVRAPSLLFPFILPTAGVSVRAVTPVLARMSGGTVTSLGKAVLPNGQPAHYLLDFEHVWQIREDGVPRFEFLGETVTEQLADQNSEQRIATVTGPGTLATLQWAAVMPPGFPDIVFKLDALKDSFSEVNQAGQYALDTGLWNASSGGTWITLNPVGSARVTATPATTFLGTTAYDATQSLISAQVTPIVSPDPAGNTLDNSQVTQFYIQDIAKGYYILMGVSASSFYAKYSGPSGTFTQIIADIGTFSTAASGSQTYAYWMISENNGWFYVWTSADGQIWSKQFSVQHTGWNPTFVAFYFAAAYDVSGTEYATITALNANVVTSSLAGPAYYNEPIVATWLDQLAKAQARGTAPFIAAGRLSSVHDSFGNPWSDQQSVQLQNGTDLLALLQAHAGMINADYIMLPGFRLQVGIPAATGKITLGTDRSQQIVFRDGHDSLTRTRTRQRNQIQNLVAAINSDGRVATFDDTSSASQWGQREGWVQAAVQVTEADIAIVAQAAAEQAGDEVLSWTLQVLPGVPGHRVFSDFQVGDWVGLERPDFSAVDAVRVTAIAVQLNADGSQVHELTLVSYVRWLQEQLTYIATKMGGGFLNAAGTTAITAGINQISPTIFSPTLTGLSDVSAAAPGSNAPLVYNPVTGKWVPAGSLVSVVIAGSGGTVSILGDGSGIQVNGSSVASDISAAGSLFAALNATVGGTLSASQLSANNGSVSGNFSAGGSVSGGSFQVGNATITQSNFNMSPPMAIPSGHPYLSDPNSGPNWASGERGSINQYLGFNDLVSSLQNRGMM